MCREIIVVLPALPWRRQRAYTRSVADASVLESTLRQESLRFASRGCLNTSTAMRARAQLPEQLLRSAQRGCAVERAVAELGADLIDGRIELALSFLLGRGE